MPDHLENLFHHRIRVADKMKRLQQRVLRGVFVFFDHGVHLPLFVVQGPVNRP